jgi:MFS family permease
LLYFALGGQLFFLPFDLINIQGYTATRAGAAFLPFSLMMAALSRWSGGLNERYGARLLLIVGPLVVAGGLTLFAIPAIGGSYWTTFFPAMIVLGFGMTLSVAPLTTTAMSAVADQYAGAASGINNATARIAAMLAVALLGAVAVGVFRSALDQRLERLQTPAAIRQALQSEVQKLAEASPPPQADSANRQTLQRALDEAFVSSFRVTTLIAALAALLSAACAWLTIKLPPARPRPANLRGIDAPNND